MSGTGPKPLLAKSLTPGREPLSLVAHGEDTEQAACAIFRDAGRWSYAWARFFRLDRQGRERFLLNLRVAALFHDVGKANEDFQALMTRQGRGPGPQTFRHEHLSALILSLPAVRGWLETNPALDADVITAAVLSHHLKASDQDPWRWGQPHTANPRLRLYLDHPEVRALFDRVRQVAALGPVPELPSGSWSLAAPWTDVSRRGRQNAVQLGRSIRKDDARQALLLAVKSGVIVADTVASGLFRVGGSMDQWIEEVVHMERLTGDAIAEKIVAPRVQQISQRAGKPFVFHRFQELAAEQGRRALLLAGCGAGKTLAAWRWAECQARAEPIGRVIFLYPTRGTATEGFRDYVGWAPSGEAALLHGTASYELEAMRENPPESMQGKEDKLRREDQARLYALEHWPRRFFSATVDQFLGFMEHSYTSMCLLPTLADSALIFDEVHSYDRRMFKALRAFLDKFDVPVLCMTATLPPDRRAELAECGLVAFPGEQHRAELEDLEVQECRPRYLVRRVDSSTRALEHAVDAHRAGQRVLWVVNTVRECLRVADLVAEQLGAEPLVYHSRFRLCDRKLAHERTMEAFRPATGPTLAVTTQVCEMSLDLDADMLITEVAPVTSLVQRFGRSNRSPTRPSTDRASVLWYSPERHLPYSRDELAAGTNLLVELGASEVSQRSLSEALKRHAPPAPSTRAHAPFLSGGYYALPGSLREERDHTRLAVLDGDLDELLALKRRHAPYDGLLLPVPKRAVKSEERPSELPRHLSVAPSSRYSPIRGFGVENGD